MLSLDALAESRILEAIERGELDDLPGAGRPLDLEDDRFVPPELRAAYRVLKNAGYVPPEVDALRQIADLERLLDAPPDASTRDTAHARLSLLRAYLEARPGARTLDDSKYRTSLYARLGRSARS